MKSLFTQARVQRARYVSSGLVALALLLAGASNAQAQTTVAGSLPGQASVSPNGAPTYNIPLDIPPGVSGMQPQLALQYDGHSGNGPIAAGWSLAGQSTIGRCPRTLAVDGVRGAVKYDDYDRFCLDGRRLVLVGGLYGQSGAEYRTEQDSFARIISYGRAGNGPEYFKVWSKSGQVAEYGNSADSRREVQGGATVQYWSLNRIEDAKRNYLTLTYIKDLSSGWHYLSRIDYAGNAALGTAPANRIEFPIESQAQTVIRYDAGSIVRNPNRFSAIKAYSDNVLTHHYKLRYVTGKNLLAGVSRCDAANNCFAETKFDYRPAAAVSFTGTMDPIPLSGINGASGQVYVGDWNADGFADMLWFDPPSGTNRWFISNGTLPATMASNLISPSAINGTNVILHFGDWNGDGITDVMSYDRANGENRWFTNNGNLGFSGPNAGVTASLIYSASGGLVFGDWNNDGRTDFMWFDPPTGTNRWYINNGGLTFGQASNPINAGYMNSSSGSLDFGDWNGDGVIDVLWYEPVTGTNRWFVHDGNLGFTLRENPIGTAAINGTDGNVYVGDWNGDGISDIMRYVPSTGDNRWWVNTGNFTFAQQSNPIAATALNSNSGVFNVGDWNGDGLMDVMWIDAPSGENRWFLGDGNLNFTSLPQLISPSSINATPSGFHFGDWNGDGLTDVLWFRPASGENRWFSARDSRDWFLSSVTTGDGHATQFTLKPLTDGTVYAKDTGANAAASPRIDMQMPMYVVSKISSSNGVGGMVNTHYTYGGLKLEQGTGRGMLGYRWTKAASEETGVEVYSEYRQDWPYTGVVAKSETRRPGFGNSGILKRATNTHAQVQGSAAPSIFVFTSQSVEESWDLNGAVLPTFTTTSQYGQNPQYGDPTQVQIGASDGSSKTTVNEYLPANTSSGNWILGRLKKSSVTSYKP